MNIVVSNCEELLDDQSNFQLVAPDRDLSRSSNHNDGYNTFGTDNGRRSDDKDTRAVSDKMFTIQEAVDTMGFGLFQIKMTFIFGLVNLAESMEMMLISVLSSTLKCVFHLDSFQQSALSMIVFLGIFVSAGFWGKLGDKYGRKTAVVISSVMYGYFGILATFSPSFSWILINRLCVGIGIGGFLQTMTLYAEFVPTKARSHAMVLIGVIWSMGACFEILLAMFTFTYLTWRWLLFLTACPTFIFVALCKMLPESPRYLLSHGRYEQAISILNQISQTNGKKLPEGRLNHSFDKVTQKNRFRDIFTPKLLRTTLLLGLAMSATCMAYFGTVLLTTSLLDLNDGCHGYTSQSFSKQASCWSFCATLGKNEYLDLFFTSMGDIPGLFLCVALMSKLGRLPALTILLSMFTLTMLVCNICLPRLVLVVLLFCARGVGNGAVQGIFVYIAEVYPTPVRAIGMGWCSSLRSIGVIISVVMSVMLVNYSAFLGISSFAVIGLIGALAFYFLPYETRNKDMPETLGEETH